MKHIFHKIVSVLLCAAMLTNSLPISVFAVRDEFVPAESETILTDAVVETPPIEAPPEDDSELITESLPEFVLTEEIITTATEYVTISGTVVDEDDNGLGDVSVLIFDATDGDVLELCTTSSAGIWSTSSIAVVGNEYAVRYHKPGWSFANVPELYTAVAGGLQIEEESGILHTAFGAETAAEDFTYSVLNGTYITIDSYTSGAAHVVIPSEIDGYTVQAISSKAFQKNLTLESVRLPDTLETLGTYAFDGCTALTTVGFNDKLTTIDSYAFRNCTALAQIDLPNSLTALHYNAFANCTGLTAVELP
ncbi:MAG: leucine-rich repeat domain-containing protein, partial [Butyricicoccus sp.]|nr:leucine-rich repeat domain-containing protein [Butyricicoccus sp.]